MSNYFKFTRLETDNARDNYALIKLKFKLQDPALIHGVWVSIYLLNSTKYLSESGLTYDRIFATTNQLLGAVL